MRSAASGVIIMGSIATGAAVKRNVRRETRLYQIAMRQGLHGAALLVMVCGKVCELV